MIVHLKSAVTLFDLCSVFGRVASIPITYNMDSSKSAQKQLLMYLVSSYRRHAVVNRQTESDSQNSGKGSRAAETNRQTGAAAGAAGMTEAVSTHDDEQLEVMTTWFYAFICFICFFTQRRL